jgi:hypothetical protein
MAGSWLRILRRKRSIRRRHLLGDVCVYVCMFVCVWLDTVAENAATEEEYQKKALTR